MHNFDKYSPDIVLSTFYFKRGPAEAKLLDSNKHLLMAYTVFDSKISYYSGSGYNKKELLKTFENW